MVAAETVDDGNMTAVAVIAAASAAETALFALVNVCIKLPLPDPGGGAGTHPRLPDVLYYLSYPIYVFIL